MRILPYPGPPYLFRAQGVGIQAWAQKAGEKQKKTTHFHPKTLIPQPSPTTLCLCGASCCHAGPVCGIDGGVEEKGGSKSWVDFYVALRTPTKG